MSTPQYNRIIRKLVVGFGNLFNDITLVRYNPDNSEEDIFASNKETSVELWSKLHSL